jgi:hypothetical protein
MELFFSVGLCESKNNEIEFLIWSILRVTTAFSVQDLEVKLFGCWIFHAHSDDCEEYLSHGM